MLKRKVIQQLTEWKNTPGKKPLVIKGCRQCGKTFAVRTFAKDNLLTLPHYMAFLLREY